MAPLRFCRRTTKRDRTGMPKNPSIPNPRPHPCTPTKRPVHAHHLTRYLWPEKIPPRHEEVSASHHSPPSGLISSMASQPTPQLPTNNLTKILAPHYSTFQVCQKHMVIGTQPHDTSLPAWNQAEDKGKQVRVVPFVRIRPNSRVNLRDPAVG